MPRRKRNQTHLMYSMSEFGATTSVDDQPCSTIQQEHIPKKKRIDPVGVGSRPCQVVLKNIDEDQLLQKAIAVDAGENITKFKMFQKCYSAVEDSDKKVSENEIQKLRSVDEDKNQGKTTKIIQTFTTIDTNNSINFFEKEIPQESQSVDEGKTPGMGNKMLRKCDTADENNGKDNEITQECGSGDGGKNRGAMIFMLQKFVNPTVDAENVKDNAIPRECQSEDGDKNQTMMTKLLQNCNNSTVDALKNEMSHKSMSFDEDRNPKATPQNEYVREASRRRVLTYRGSSSRGNFKEADHDYCAWFDDNSSNDEEYVPNLDIFGKGKLKYEDDSNWSPPNKKGGKRKRAKRSSTSNSRIERGKSEDNRQDVPGHSNLLSNNSSKSSSDPAVNSNDKSEYGPKPSMSNFEKKKKKAEHLTNKSRSALSKSLDLKASIQPVLQHATVIKTPSKCSPKHLLQFPTIKTEPSCSPKLLLQHPTTEPKSVNYVKTGEEVQEDDDDCVICFVGEKKTTPEATSPNALLNKYVLHCQNYQIFNAEADSACMYCSKFIDLDAVKILAVADVLGDPKKYVETGIRHAEAEFESLKNSAGKLLAEEQFKLKVVETRIKILKKAMDLLLEFGSFEYYVIDSEMFRIHNM